MKAANDILVIGGGIVGLAIAVELRLRGASVTVVSQDFARAASHAAAGMLAPRAEKITNSSMLDLCLKSRWLYPEWIRKLEDLTGIATGYLPCGIIAPVFNQPQSQSDLWLDRATLEFYQPGLGETVVGGWWYPEDGQVDNRCLMRSLLQAVQTLGVEVKEGVAVTAIGQRQGKVTSVFTSMGELEAEQYVLATGSWTSQLLPIPVRPVKGQMLALRMPAEANLNRILYGEGSYLVPRQDGRLIVGATVEEAGWNPHNTPQGIQSLLEPATKIIE